MKITTKSNRITAFFLALMMIVGLIPATLLTVSAESPQAGANGFIAKIDPPAQNSVAISDRAGLEAMKNNLNGAYHLTKDIDLSGKEWEPIGSDYFDNFTGTFDGQGHVIRNLTIKTASEYTGLFGYISGATIKNVGLVRTDIDITSDSSVYAGGICGYVSGGFKSPDNSISNCYNTGNISVSASGSYIGGLCGYIYNSISINYCYNTGNISDSASSAYSGAYAGGIYGRHNSSNPININDCYNTGNISAIANSVSGSYAYAGGIGGNYYSGFTFTINNCYNTGDVYSSAYAGGICSGSNSGGTGSSPGIITISNCYNAGDVSGGASTGGVCGYVSDIGASGTVINISNCYNTGNVSGFGNSHNAYAGGICSYASSGTSISNCYNTGKVSGSGSGSGSGNFVAYAGGICGSASVIGSGSDITVNNCYNTGDLSASASGFVNSSSYTGGICGNSFGSVTINNCYWNSESAQIVNDSPVAAKKGLGTSTSSTNPTVALTSAQMKNNSSFNGWDFKNVWGFIDRVNGGYPILRAFDYVPDLLYGDVDGNGYITAADIVCLARHIAEIESITDSILLKAADINNDGKINIADLILLSQMLVNN